MSQPDIPSLRIRRLAQFVAGLMVVSASVGGLAALVSAETPGSQLWVKRYDGPVSGDESVKSIALSPDGSKVFVTGSSQGSRVSYDYATVAYDASTGAKLWVKRYDGPGRFAFATALEVSPDGSRVFVTGYSVGSTTYFSYATVAYDASTGASLWVKRYDGTGAGDDLATALSVSPDGSKVFVTGSSTHDYGTVAYDVSTGATLWVKRYDGPVNSSDLADALGVSPDGSKVFVTGGSLGSASRRDYATLAYEAATGAKLWAKRYDGPGHHIDSPHALGVSPDGSKVFVTGGSRGSTGTHDYATIAYDAATGARLWVKRYDGIGSKAVNDIAHALGVSTDGSKVFVTGESAESTGGYDYATMALDASSGARLWEQHYDGSRRYGDAFDARALGVSPDGSRVFVTRWMGSGSYDYGTVAYRASTGARLWQRRYDGGSVDVATDLGVSLDGYKVFVTGYSLGSESGLDYATVAYVASSQHSPTPVRSSGR